MRITFNGKQILTLGKHGAYLELVNAITDPWTHMGKLKKAVTRMYGPVIAGRMAKACGGNPDPTRAKNQSVMAKTYGLLIVGDVAFNVQPDKVADIWVADNALNRLTKRVMRLEKKAQLNDCRYHLDKLELPQAKGYRQIDPEAWPRVVAKIEDKCAELESEIKAEENCWTFSGYGAAEQHAKLAENIRKAREALAGYRLRSIDHANDVRRRVQAKVDAHNAKVPKVNKRMDAMRRENLVLACCGVTNLTKATPVGLSRLHYVLTGSAT